MASSRQTACSHLVTGLACGVDLTKGRLPSEPPWLVPARENGRLGSGQDPPPSMGHTSSALPRKSQQRVCARGARGPLPTAAPAAGPPPALPTPPPDEPSPFPGHFTAICRAVSVVTCKSRAGDRPLEPCRARPAKQTGSWGASMCLPVGARPWATHTWLAWGGRRDAQPRSGAVSPPK